MSPVEAPTAAISRRIDELFTEHRDLPAVEHDRSWSTWGDLAAVADAVDDAVDDAGLGPDAPVAIVLRERPDLVGALLGGLRRGRCAVLQSPLAPTASLVAELETGLAPVLVAAESDWSHDGVRDAARRAGVLAVEISPGGSVSVGEVAPGSRRPAQTGLTGVAVTLLTSGTTGDPKRVPLSYGRLDAMLGVRPPGDPRLARGATINSLPLVSVGGFLGVVSSVWRGRPLAIMERFDVTSWAALVREHRPRRVGAPPAVLRMILDARIPDATFESVTCFETGSAPLDPALAEEFEGTYSIPVLQSYGATEFLAAVVTWTLEDWKEWSAAKRGSVGRAVVGTSLRVVDDAGGTVDPNSSGRLEVMFDPVGEPQPAGWTRTNDLARIDADGFVWILGRLDDVLVRGGFKVALREVERVLAAHPAVDEVVVVPLDDARLGQVPVAVVTEEPGGCIDVADLLTWAKGHLEPYKVPVDVVVLDDLPRNSMMKISRPELVDIVAGAIPSRTR